jgi:hypothetical protein
MEYIHGKTVAERIRDSGPLGWVEALEVILDTARALAAARRKEMIHRDIKPSNLMLGEITPGAHRAHIKVTDFGLATDTHQAEGRFVGTPYYAAPEQIAGAAPNFRSDIYSLAVTFYELLTGQVPFVASDLASMAKLHQMAARPVIPDHVAPWRLRQLINQMMDPDPGRRPNSYDDLIARLESLRFKPRMAGGLIARGAALAVDLALVAPFAPIAVSVLGWSQIAATWFGVILFAAYCVFTHRLWGRSLGKRLLGLQLVGTTRRITVARLLLRFVVQFWGPLVALFAIFLQWGAGSDLLAVKDHLTELGGLHPLWDRSLESLLRTLVIPNLVVVLPWLAGFVFGIVDHDRQTLHDRAAHTRVLFHVTNESNA